MEEIVVHSAEVPLQQPEGYPDRMHRRILRVAPDGSPRVALLKLDAGFEMDAHSHPTTENHYVLEGMYESQGREYPKGTYRMIPRHTTHGPFRSPEGATVLVFWES